MSQIILSILPKEGVKLILNKLPSRRMKDVVSKRFGLKGGKGFTLEAIGKEYKITRERVRQIEVEALKHLRKEENRAELRPLLKSVEEHLKNNGEVMAEHILLSSLSSREHHPHLLLLLETAKIFQSLPETDLLHARWAVDKNTGEAAEKVIASLVRELEDTQSPVSKEKLLAQAAEQTKKILGQTVSEEVLNSYLACSKSILPNPYGEYGLVSWPVISPRGIKDKAYVALAKARKPLHFREVAKTIDGARWSTPHATCIFKSGRKAQCKLCIGSKRKAHPQTVHNELIKDGRFVLVGRGLYALKEWGYEPGVVRDILVSVLKQAAKPLPREEIVKLVLEKRMVKAPTIFLNLQNKTFFKRTDEGKFTLV